MRVTISALAVLLALSGTAFASDAHLGAPAPALTIAKTVKGEPITTFRPGKVYVVEFWATWCGPCKVSIPHLSEMAKKYKDVSFLGVSVWESQHGVKTTDLPKVDSFVKTMGDKMAYNVAADTENGDMAKNWMAAYGQNGIPAAFIVNREGQVAYIDHPMSPQFEKNLQAVVAGTVDIAKAREEMDARSATLTESRKSMVELTKAVGEVKATVIAQATRLDFDAAEQTMQAVVDAHPVKDEEGKPSKASAQAQVLRIVQASDEALYMAYVHRIVKSGSASPELLNSMAWNIADNKKFKNPDYALAAVAAIQACDKTGWNDWQILDTLGLALFKSGKTAWAIEVQTKAVALATDAASKKDLQDRLDSFKAKK